MTTPERVPRSSFPYEAVPAEDRFAAWSESIAPLFTPRVAAHATREDVRVATDVFSLGDALFGRSETHGVGGYRCAGNGAVRERSDAVLVQLYLSGGFTGINGTESLHVRAGDVVVLDTTRPMLTEVTDSAILSLVLPRGSIVREAAGPDFAPCVIAGESGAGRVLGQTFLSTWDALPGASGDDAEALRGLLLGAVAGVMRGTQRADDARHEAAFDRAKLDAICVYIERNLGDDELSPAQLCRIFGCSRAQLYRLFAPVGGVAGFIRNARLERAHAELLHADESVTVLDVALRWGFGNDSHFSRLFRQTFGLTPRDARAMGRAARVDAKAVAASSKTAASGLPAYRAWFLQL